MIKKYTKKNKKYKINRNKKGGEAIASGGFGCIFNPALKCKTKKKRTDGVSKLLMKENAIIEYTIDKKIKKYLKKIKNYKKYFLFDSEICEPDKLTNNDLQNFDIECYYPLQRKNINSMNVNNNLDQLRIINMPFAGIEMHDWLTVNKIINKDKAILLNKIVIDLIKNAIVPMNNIGIIHNDLKDRNILINNNNDPIIIDFGLAGVIENKNKIPEKIMNRPLQFNLPFSQHILSNSFINSYNNFLNDVKSNKFIFNRDSIKLFVIDNYNYHMQKYSGYGEDSYIIYIFNYIFGNKFSNTSNIFYSQEKNNIIIQEYFLPFYSNYVADILIKFTTSEYKFDYKKYVLNIYSHNTDIYGLMTVYFNFFMYNLNFEDELDIIKTKYLNSIRNIIIEYMFTNGADKINTKNLIKDIKKLNRILK